MARDFCYDDCAGWQPAVRCCSTSGMIWVIRSLRCPVFVPAGFCVEPEPVLGKGHCQCNRLIRQRSIKILASC